MRQRTLWTFVVLVAIAVAVACSRRSDVPPVSIIPDGGGGASTAAGATGTSRVTGTITFDGDVPPAETIRMNSDPVCVMESDEHRDRVLRRR